MINKIKRMIDWFPVIWKDYDYDYHSLYVVMQKKLTRLEAGIRDGWAVDSEATADNIHLAVMLLDRLIECDYLERALIPVHRKWGESDMLLEDAEDGLTAYIGLSFEKASTEKERLIAEEAFRKAGRRADAQELADKNLLFEHLSRNIKGWWD